MGEATKGPYEVKRAHVPQDGEYDYALIADVDGKRAIIAEVWGRVGENSRPDAKATAELLAQAPAMLEALKEIAPDPGPERCDCDRLACYCGNNGDAAAREAWFVARDLFERVRPIVAAAEGRDQ